MTIEEISEILNTTETKINEIKTLITDINVCQSERSKTILLAAATKLVEQFKITKV